MILDFFEHKFYFLRIKMEFEKTLSFLHTTFDNKDLTRFVTKQWIEVNHEDIAMLIEKLESKLQC